MTTRPDCQNVKTASTKRCIGRCFQADFFHFATGRKNHRRSISAYKPSTIGCSTHLPTGLFRFPMTKGTTAPPVMPKAEMTPIAAALASLSTLPNGGLRISFSSSIFITTLIAQGYPGPMKNPTNATDKPLATMPPFNNHINS
ncbi:hypothetical protein QC764_0098570 [Podospora pseudoanserina]|uniref:Uncharacterized protein n=1 Tax=Podospora pseudoanserina TaxID=2609844 RepID=A0ABR0HUE6_9PEZI|nr:hypothetical protein QC764_0098570 [Podospora pseudoanserina]